MMIEVPELAEEVVQKLTMIIEERGQFFVVSPLVNPTQGVLVASDRIVGVGKQGTPVEFRDGPAAVTAS